VDNSSQPRRFTFAQRVHVSASTPNGRILRGELTKKGAKTLQEAHAQVKKLEVITRSYNGMNHSNPQAASWISAP